MKTFLRVLGALTLAAAAVAAAAALIDRAYGRRHGNIWHRLCKLLGLDRLCRSVCNCVCDCCCDCGGDFDDDWDPWEDWREDEDEVLERIQAEVSADLSFNEDEKDFEDFATEDEDLSF